MNDKQHDELLDAYRRAGERNADRPSAATRTAILAEAAAAARRNAPAANESRYWLRAVAGVAVLGIGVVLWRQTDERLSGESPVVATTPVTQTMEGVAKAERAPPPASAPELERAAGGSNAVNGDRAVAQTRRELPLPQAFPASPAVEGPFVTGATEAPPPAVALPPPSRLAQNALDNEELSEVTVAGARIQTSKSERAATAPPPAGAAAPRTGDSVALLRQHFPSQYQSDAPHSVWLVLSAAGEVLQSGELATGQRIADLAPQLAVAPGDRVPGPWQVQTLRNARGQPIELAVAQIP